MISRNHLLELGEVDEQADRIELRPFDRNAHAIVVPVHVFAFAAITAQRVTRRKCLFDANLKHPFP